MKLPINRFGWAILNRTSTILVKRPYWNELIAAAWARLQPTFSQEDPKHFHDPWKWHTPWSNILAQYIFDPAAIECLCISSNYLRARLRCKRSIRSYCKQAVQHCRLSEAIASRLCSTAGCNLMRHQTGDINAYQVDQVCLSRDIDATTPGNLLGAASCSLLSASSR